jgi:hypothetical protein
MKTLPEVKEHFKNAKEVRCLADREIYEIDIESADDIASHTIWCKSINDFDVRLSKGNQFAEIISYKEIPVPVRDYVIDTPKHYDNSKGSLYLFAENNNLNSWEFDAIKRIVRCRKKGNFKEDIEKTINVLKLYLDETKI